MKRNKRVYFILGSIPVAFGLFLLTMVNVLYALLAIVVLLALALILKKKKPEWFPSFGKKPKEETEEPPATSLSRHDPPQVVYLVLAAQNQNNMQRIPVDKARFSIGRSEDSDYIIDDGNISRHHLRIEYDELAKIASAMDLASKNHSYLNGEMMEPNKRYTLSQGDQLMIYDYVFVVDMANYG